MFSPELKKGSVEMLILSLLEERPRHGYEIGKLIEARTSGRLAFRIPSLYPILYRLEKKGLVKGRWIEKQGQRRRCYYRLTELGTQSLAEKKEVWADFTAAIDQVLGIQNA